MDLEFTDAVFEWRGPAPYHFVWVPEDDAALIQELASAITYGWGMIPVAVTIGETDLDDLAVAQGRAATSCRSRTRSATPRASSLDDVVTVRLRIDV